MKKYILATFALIAMCFSAMAEKTVANNAFQLNYKNETVAPLQARLLGNPRFVFSEDGSEITLYKGTTATSSVIKVDSVKSLAYIYMPHVHNITLVADTVMPTDETTGTLAYWQCTGTEQDPGCMLYFADSLGTQEIGNDSLLNVWLAKGGEGFLPCVYENNKIYAVIGDTLIVRTDRISEMKNVVEDSLNYFHMTYTRLGEQQTYHAHHIVRDLRDGVVFKTGKQLMPTTGIALRDGNVIVKWVQLWENGPKFAEYNVGAENNKAEDYGGYYCWGKSIDKDPSCAIKEGSDPLSGNEDTATNLWGNNWRMLTQAELEALLANCDVEWTVVNGVNGRKFTGKGDFASNSVFLPAAGRYLIDSLYGPGECGAYWSSTPEGSDFAHDLIFGPGSQVVNYGDRYYGYSVRAVLVEE